MLRNLIPLAVLGLALSGDAEAARPSPDAKVTVMTQNMDDGTDQTYIVAALMGDPRMDMDTAVELTLAELQASDFSRRNGLLASEIAKKKPDLLALQEAALWRFGATPDTATIVLYDQVALLVSALNAAGVPYDVVAVNRLTDLAAYSEKINGALRFTDRNAILVRSDLKPPKLHLSNVHARTFDTALPFGPMTVTAGWISADVHVGNRQFRLVTTHLESPIPGVPEATDVQMAQANELLHELRNLTAPVVICGDFNSDANHGNFVDATPTADLIQAAGYTEVWPATHGPGDAGLTWPYFLEDQLPPPAFFVPFPPQERIDLLFTKGLAPVSSDLVIVPQTSNASAPPFASDHAGVIAAFQF